jgi:leucyl aminopeptidase
MKFLFALSATASVALAGVIPQQEPLAQTIPSIVQNTQTTRWLIELSPYQTRWVTEEEKWALKLVCFISSFLFLFPCFPLSPLFHIPC